MNKLDIGVDSWVFDPMSQPTCTVKDFRRWAIKIALLRAMVDNPALIERSDFTAVMSNEDVPEWRIYVGHAEFREFRHAYASIYAPLASEGDSPQSRLTHVTWVLGNAVVSAMRLIGPNADFMAKPFDEYIFGLGWPLASLAPDADDFPSFELRPRLTLGEVESIAWFYTPEPESPIADLINDGHL